MTALLWFAAAAVVLASVWLFDVDAWLQGGRPLSAREGWFLIILASIYVSYSAFRTMREGFDRIDHEIARRVRELRIQDASIRAYVIRAVGPRDDESIDDVNERANQLFIRELENFDPELAREERERQARFDEALRKPFFGAT